MCRCSSCADAVTIACVEGGYEDERLAGWLACCFGLLFPFSHGDLAPLYTYIVRIYTVLSVLKRSV